MVATPSGAGATSYPSAAAQNRAIRSGSAQSMTSWKRTGTGSSSDRSAPRPIPGRPVAGQYCMTTSNNPGPAGPAPAYADPLTKGLPTDRALQAARQILGAPHLAVLATTNPDGSAQLSVIFVKPDGDDVLFSTIEGRRKSANLARDPRVTLLLHRFDATATDSAYATLRGSAEITDDPDGSFHQVMYGQHM